MSVTRLHIMRIRQLGAPKKMKHQSQVSQLIIENICEIEKMFTLFYLHPCYYLELVEGLQPIEYPLFINGIKNLYKEMGNSIKKSESFDNMLLISTFRIIADIDYANIKDLDNLFTTTTSMSELIIELYFYNVINMIKTVIQSINVDRYIQKDFFPLI